MKSIAIFFAVIAVAVLTIKFDDSASSAARITDTAERLKYVSQSQGYERADNTEFGSDAVTLR